MSIDRASPRLRPSGPAAGTQRWRDLLFVHWPVPVAALRPLVPRGLEIDTHEGTAYVGIVPFAMEGVRMRGTPPALSLAFLETNLRTYVHVEGRDPGVYFFSLDAASLLAVLGARAGFGLPYFHARMSLRRTAEAVRYEVRRLALPFGTRPARLDVAYRPGEHLGPSREGTLEHFLLERYLLHVERGGRLFSAQVHHPPYPAQRASVLAIEESLCAAAGLPRPPGPPPLAHYAWGVDVEVFAPRPARGSEMR